MWKEERNLPIKEKERIYAQRAATGDIFASTWQIELANIKMELRKYSEAIQIFESALNSMPKSVHIWYPLGKSYLAVGNIAKAKQCFEKALELVPKKGHFTYSVREIQESLSQVS